jgi:hypothetical protein
MFDWSRANETELLQTCREAGINVRPGLPNERLAKLLTGEEEAVEEDANPIDSWRNALMDFLLDYWMMARGQIDCPAKELECWTERPTTQQVGVDYGPRRKPGLPPGRIACRTCTDAQVMCCIIQNAPNQHLIEQRRRNK